MSNLKNINIAGTDMKHAPMPSRDEIKDPIGPKIAGWGIILMIIYLFIAR